MNATPQRRSRARKGALVARAAVVMGLATSVGLLVAGDARDGERIASAASCNPHANAPFAAL